jgi:hypothetical protein
VAKTLVEWLEEGIIRDAIPLRDVPRRLPKLRNGKHPHTATIHRWARDGLRGRKLWTFRVGGTLCTTAEALADFFEHISNNASAPQAAQAPARRERANQQVERELDQIGI